MNDLADLSECKKITYRQISNYLYEIGIMEKINNNDRETLCPTPQGIEMGITVEKRLGPQGEYTVIVYNRSAQQFILDNLDAFCSKNEETEKGEYQGQPWSEEHQACLIELFQKGVPVNEIAVTLQRTPGGIRARLKRLGLIENRSDAK